MLVQASTAASSPNICTNDCHKLQVGRWTSIVERTKDRLDFNQYSFSSYRCGEQKVVRTRIVGGQNAQKNEYPWQVYFIKKYNQIIRN